MSIEGELNRTRGRPKRTGPSVLSPGEFQVMELIWKSGSLGSAQVCSAMRNLRGLAYTTVMTFLDKLHSKGFLVIEPQGRASRYRPAITREEALHRCLHSFLHDYFQGSLATFLEFLDQNSLPHDSTDQNHAWLTGSHQEKKREPSPPPDFDPDLLDVELL